MKVKESKKKLKGQYADIRPVHADHRKATPFTQPGKGLVYAAKMNEKGEFEPLC